MDQVLDQLALLDTFVRARSLIAASRRLEVSAEWLRSALASLGEELGVPLVDPFDRPTSSARRLAAPALRVLEASADFFAEADESASGSVAARPPSVPTAAGAWRRGRGVLPSVAVTDLRGRYLQVGSDFALMVGRAPSDMIGVGFQRMTHEGDLAADEAQDDAIVAGSLHSATKTKRYVTMTGLVRTARVAVAKVIDGAEEILVVQAMPTS